MCTLGKTSGLLRKCFTSKRFKLLSGELKRATIPQFQYMCDKTWIEHLDVYGSDKLSATWSSNGATTAEFTLQIKSARFTEQHIFSSPLNTPLPACSLIPASRSGCSSPTRPHPSACSFRATRLLVHVAEGRTEKPLHIASRSLSFLSISRLECRCVFSKARARS